MFFEAQTHVFNFFNAYAKIVSEVSFEATQEEVFSLNLACIAAKIWLPNQMLQRLAIAFAQVKFFI